MPQYRIFFASLVALALSSVCSLGNIVVNGDFSSGFYDGYSNKFGGDTALNSLTYSPDDGWVVFNDGSGDAWTITGGEVVREKGDPRSFVPRGIGQIVSDGGLGASGNTITFQFTYDLTQGAGGVDFTYYLVGFAEAPGGGWLEFSGDSIDLDQAIPDNTDGNYDMVNLVSSTISGDTSGSFSQDITLSQDFDYFGIAFIGEVDDNGDILTLDNVTLFDTPPDESIPTLSEWGMIILVVVLAGIGVRHVYRGQEPPQPNVA